jgi:anti-anti-sigma regulatory factor
MSIVAEPGEQTQTIRLNGCVDIQAAAELKRALEAALEGEGSVRVDVSALESVDVTAVQLLWAARSRAVSTGREFRVDGPWNAETEEHSRKAGISLTGIFAAPGEQTGGSSGLER